MHDDLADPGQLLVDAVAFGRLWSLIHRSMDNIPTRAPARRASLAGAAQSKRATGSAVAFSSERAIGRSKARSVGRGGVGEQCLAEHLARRRDRAPAPAAVTVQRSVTGTRVIVASRMWHREEVIDEASEVELSERDLRVVARYGAESAAGALSIFEERHPGDRRPRDAVEVAWSFADKPADERLLPWLRCSGAKYPSAPSGTCGNRAGRAYERVGRGAAIDLRRSHGPARCPLVVASGP
jgi:hypothetical protein